MNDLPSRPLIRRHRPPAFLAASSLLLLLAACGGGGSDPSIGNVASETLTVEPSGTVDDRSFTLWAPGTEADVLDEQRALYSSVDPSTDGSTVQLIVRLNPAAVLSDGRVAMAGAVGNGESGDAAALQASLLAAKVNAVATAANAVMTRSVLRAAPGAVVRQQFSHAVEAFVVSVPWAQAAAVAADLARNPAVDGVEPDRSFSVGQTASGVRTLDTRAWGVDRIDQRARQFDSSFRQSLTGSGVNVYVVDTGVNPHNEFGNRLVAGFTSINDGRGTKDCHGHGTHVAGTAAGANLGVAPGARVVPVRVMDCSGRSAGSQLLAGLDWVAAKGSRPGVVNMSLGGAASATVDAATQRLMGAGFTVVAAAGNSNADACTQSPGRAAGAVTVAASDKLDAKASFSNWGNCVALWAPGAAISSAGIASPTAVVAMNGTSMAAPHAAGAVALLLQGMPTLVPAQVRQQLLARASAQAVTGAPGTMTKSLLYAGVSDGAAGAPVLPVSPVPTTPAPTTVSVRSIALSAQVPVAGAWRASAAVQVVNGSGQAVAGAQVVARFSNMSTPVMCTTAASGSCNLVSADAAWSTVPVLGFAVTEVKGNLMVYTGGAGIAQIARPAAPAASLTALTGSMVRSSARAVAWSPQFLATVKNERGVAVPGAHVQAVLQVHAGARVAGLQTVSCQTGSTGQCLLNWSGPALNATHTGAKLQVLNVVGNYMTYKPGAITSVSVGTVR